jgi:outer membrane protein TolC
VISLLLGLTLAATPLTLDDVRKEARANPQALLSALDYARAAQNTRAQRSALLPSVTAGVSAGYEWTGPQSLIEPTTQFDPVTGAPTGVVLQQQTVPGFNHANFSLNGTLTQLLFDWTRFKNLGQAGAQESAARAQVEEQLQFAEYEAVRRFYVLLTAQRSQLVLDANARRSQEQVERAEALFQAAHGTKGDVMAAEINLNNDHVAALRQHATVVQSEADLAGWLGRSETEELRAVDPGTLEGPLGGAPELGQVVETAHAHRPLLRVVDRQLSAAREGLSAAEGGYAPRIKLQAIYQRNGDTAAPVFTDAKLQNDFLAGVFLQWDLFNGFATDAAVKTAEHSVSTARITADQTGRDVDGSLRIGVVSLNALIDVARVSEATDHKARENLQYAQERFSAGATSTLEVRDAQLKLTQAELNLLQSRADVEVARASLARLSGTLNVGEGT